MKNQILLLFYLVFISTFELFAQGEIADKRKIVFSNESSVGILLNSNGYGIGYRHAKRMDGFKKSIFEVDFVGINNPKEKRIQNPYSDINSKRFVYGKLNAFLNLRIGIGQQKEIFSKFDKGGLSIRRNYSAGVAIGILKPIYYEVLEPLSDTTYHYVSQKFSTTSIHNVYDIYGRSGFDKGLNEINITPGVYLKYSYGFEFSENEKHLRLFELGVVVDAFLKEMPIMATEDNNQIFLSLFLSYRFGSVYSKRSKNLE